MPPHLKILADLRKVKRKNKNKGRTTPTATTTATTAKGTGKSQAAQGGKGVASTLTKRVDKLAAIIASPPPPKSGGRWVKTKTQPSKSKAAPRSRGK
jgi:hypothetical protein